MLLEATEGEIAKDSGNGFIITFYYKTVMTSECVGEGNLMFQMVSPGRQQCVFLTRLFVLASYCNVQILVVFL